MVFNYRLPPGVNTDEWECHLQWLSVHKKASEPLGEQMYQDIKEFLPLVSQWWFM